jgi:hypothetical protein
MRPAVYLECLELIAARDGLDECKLQPVMLSQIMAVADELGAQMPDQYEDFLLEVGAGMEHGGLARWYHLDVTRPGNLLDANERLRQSQAEEMRAHGRKKARFPKEFLAVYDPCEGEVFGFMRSGGEFGSAVYLWDLEEHYLERIADDFCEFLGTLVDCSAEEVDLAEKRATQTSLRAG